MFCLADDDLVPRLQPRARIALRHHIDGLGCTSRPDDIFPAFGINQACDLVARGSVRREDYGMDDWKMAIRGRVQFELRLRLEAP